MVWATGDGIAFFYDSAPSPDAAKYAFYSGAAWTTPTIGSPSATNLFINGIAKACKNRDEVTFMGNQAITTACPVNMWIQSGDSTVFNVVTGIGSGLYPASPYTFDGAYEEAGGYRFVTLLAKNNAVDGSMFYTLHSGPGTASTPALAFILPINIKQEYMTVIPNSQSIITIIGTDGAPGSMMWTLWDGTTWTTPAWMSPNKPAFNTGKQSLALATQVKSGIPMLVYNSGAGTFWMWQQFINGAWSSASGGTSVGYTGGIFRICADPNSNRLLLAINDANNDLNCFVWNGSTAWIAGSEVAATTIKNSGVTDYAPFDVACESLTGNLRVFYSTFNVGGSVLRTRLLSGDNVWYNDATTCPNSLMIGSTLGSTAKSVWCDSDPNSNNIMVCTKRGGAPFDLESHNFNGTTLTWTKKTQSRGGLATCVYQSVFAFTRLTAFAQNYVQNLSETMNISESIVKTWTAYRTLTETLNLAETKGSTVTKRLTETASFTDSFIKTVTKRLTETLSATTTMSKVWTAMRTLTETLALNESKAITNTKRLSEAMSFNESKALSIIKRLTETLNTTETIAHIWTINRAFTETVAFAESRRINSTKNLSDTININESLTKTIIKRLAENVSILETLYTELIPGITQLFLNETLNINESMTRNTTKYLTESVSVTESKYITMTKILSETMTLVDSRMVSIIKRFTETLTITESISRIWTAYRTLTENMSLTETIVKGFTLRMTENLSITDTLIAGWMVYRTLSETLSVSMSVSMATVKSLAETLTLNISYRNITTFVLYLTESITISMSYMRIINLGNKLVDSFLNIVSDDIMDTFNEANNIILDDVDFDNDFG